MLTGSENFFRTLVKSSITVEKSLMIEFRATREDYEKEEITTIGWVCSKQNIAEERRKVTHCNLLDDFLLNVVFNVINEQ